LEEVPQLSRAPARWICAAALLLTACGGAPAAAVQSPSPSSSPSPSASASASPTPSPSATFALNPVNSTIKASGKILLTKGDGVFTVELQITGLQAGSSHVSHVHVGSCKAPGAIKFALNQVVADGTGAADTRTQVPASFPPTTGHWYVVVHEGPDMQGSNAAYMLCGNLG
jgi:hypothetical protein